MAVLVLVAFVWTIVSVPVALLVGSMIRRDESADRARRSDALPAARSAAGNVAGVAGA